MIGLNKIWLNQVQLNRLYLNAPFPVYRKMTGGGSSGDGFPVLPGDVTRWHFGGLTNEMMAAMDDPRIEDADGKGRFLSFKNFLWAGMSGVNGYVEDYNNSRWFIGSTITATKKADSFKITSISQVAVQLQYIAEPSQSPYAVPSYTIRVTGLTDGQTVNYRVSGGISYPIKQDGVYTLPGFDFAGMGSCYGFQFNKVQESCDITIEQLPLYPGSLVFDGVDDYGICENFPILTKEKGYTVVALRQWMETTNKVSGVVSNALTWFTDGAFVLEYRNINSGYENTPVSFGRINPNAPLTKSAFTYQTSLEYNGVKINTGTYKGVSRLMVGSVIKNNYLFKGVIWEIVILDHDATEEELQKIQDYYKQEYPWLFPDQAWTVVGKTNEDTDRATIANITGNGNNLVLSNFGFAENSGYGDYIQNFSFFRSVNLTIWNIENTYKQVKLTCLNDSVNNTSLAYWSSNEKSSYSNKKWRLYLEVSNPDIEVNLKFNGPNWEVIKSIVLKPGINEIPALSPSEFDSLGKMLSLSISKNAVLGDWVLIQQIPEYEGYLVTDGVDDKIASSNFNLDDDWTIVGEWILFGDKFGISGISKESSIYIYNISTGLQIYVKSTSKANNLQLKSLKAVSSNGVVYDSDWNEIPLAVGNIKGTSSVLQIGNRQTAFTQLAFKNISIYPTVLSKEDCIKAYNYLQTLKAK